MKRQFFKIEGKGNPYDYLQQSFLESKGLGDLYDRIAAGYDDIGYNSIFLYCTKDEFSKFVEVLQFTETYYKIVGIFEDNKEVIRQMEQNRGAKSYTLYKEYYLDYLDRTEGLSQFERIIFETNRIYYLSKNADHPKAMIICPDLMDKFRDELLKAKKVDIYKSTPIMYEGMNIYRTKDIRKGTYIFI